ncbi:MULTISPECIES: DUF4145 domain-containing protein [unclassified Aureimonas]|uniref:DUF4145 domain-containing protein n=1 Tax=unclassified Aureimonas TaxID=2615206 RepID=UPI000A5F70B0|nr:MULTISPECIES: DUF4145 domain-containing protein [unclassified Aureimonas]
MESENQSVTEISPSTSLTAFNCPHCHALARQFWYKLSADLLKKDVLPFYPSPIDRLTIDFEKFGEKKEAMERFFEKASSLQPFLERSEHYSNFNVILVNISECYNCHEIAIWIADRLVYPSVGTAPAAAGDMPADVKAVYNEASVILPASPRGASALLRLALQMLCKHLGGDGRNIDKEIGKLVAKGLDVRVQQAMDIVRVVGNNAVHPGQISFDDTDLVARQLFSLVNLTVEKMITEPAVLDSLFSSLPEGAQKAIEKRDGKA